MTDPKYLFILLWLYSCSFEKNQKISDNIIEDSSGIYLEGIPIDIIYGDDYDSYDYIIEDLDYVSFIIKNRDNQNANIKIQSLQWKRNFHRIKSFQVRLNGIDLNEKTLFLKSQAELTVRLSFPTISFKEYDYIPELDTICVELLWKERNEQLKIDIPINLIHELPHDDFKE